MLKKIIFCFLLCFYTYNTHGQDIIPNVNLKTINGQTISADEAVNKDGFTIVSFWATWCIPCINELDAINEVIS